jgi:hypothetical protein
MLISYA